MMSRTASSGAQRLQSGSLPGARGYIAPANSILVPPGAPLKLGDITQVALDVGAVIFGALLVSVTALAIPVSMFILLFVRL